MSKLNQQDLERVIKILPVQVQSLLIIYEGKLTLAGGFIRDSVLRVRAKDVDLFAISPEIAREVMDRLSSRENPILITKNSYSVKNIEGRFVQAIHRWSYPTPQELINSFDFTVSCAALWYDPIKGWDSFVDDNFYSDLAAKRLTFRFPERQEDCAGSLIRVLKFIKKGYNIPGESLAGVIARVAKEAERRNKEHVVLVPGFNDSESSQEKEWTRIIHHTIASVTGES